MKMATKRAILGRAWRKSITGTALDNTLEKACCTRGPVCETATYVLNMSRLKLFTARVGLRSGSLHALPLVPVRRFEPFLV